MLRLNDAVLRCRRYPSGVVLRSGVWRRLLLVVAGAAVVCGSTPALPDDLTWPPITQQTKPWTRWWWLGNVVESAALTEQMEHYAAAGLGGLELTPIYGVQGEEAGFRDFLSPEFLEAFEQALGEARRLDLGLDMSTGTGWPFGGPWVDDGSACRYVLLKNYNLAGGERLRHPILAMQAPIARAVGRRVSIDDLQHPLAANLHLQKLALEQVRFAVLLPLQALGARSAAGESLDLFSRVQADGTLDWTAPEGKWTLYALFQGWHGKLVERAGPGGEGNVIDHFSRAALDAYLRKFDEALGEESSGLRAWFNDSYEVDDASGQANWTPRLLDEFAARRGYDLRQELPALFLQDDLERNARVACDFRETISDLLLEEFTQPWHEWAKRRGATTRNQAHGSPAQLLDLYAASGIPETEADDRIKFMSAASAAHLGGKPLCSAEACTWQDEHFVETFRDSKAWIDRYFLGGVNHICYHGTPYSPTRAGWPGWMFYASVHFGVTNPMWRHFHALNEYVARCQSWLQTGRADTDVLIYHPIHDEWSHVAGGSAAELPHFDGALKNSTARPCAEQLLAAGYLPDFVSDRLLAEVTVDEGLATSGDGRYRAIVVPSCRLMPLSTLRQLLALARQGATIVFAGELPQGPPGLSNLQSRQAEFDRLRHELAWQDVAGAELPQATLDELVETSVAAALAEVRQATLGKGRLLRGDAVATLAVAGVLPEKLVAGRLDFFRRRYDDGVGYFLVNATPQPYAGWTPINARGEAVALFDPLTGAAGLATVRPPGSAELGSATSVYLQLAAGQSCVVRTYDHPVEGPAYRYLEPAGAPVALGGLWRVEFLDGGPGAPDDFTTGELKSWSDFPDEAARDFSGQVRYRIAFDRPAGEGDLLLDLGQVRETAAVRLNGELLASLFAPPYQVRIPADRVEATGNVLEVEVANVMANRIAAMERGGDASWKKFYNVNFPARRPENRGRDGLFTAAGWSPRPAGMLGPATLTRLK